MMWIPTFFKYPNVTELYDSMDQFMIGDSLIVHPVLTEGATSVDAFFPSDTWYSLSTGAKIATNSTGYMTVSAKLDEDIPVHVRGGSIIPSLDASGTAMSSAELLESPISMLIALCGCEVPDASGFMYVDDGQNIDGKYRKVMFNA